MRRRSGTRLVGLGAAAGFLALMAGRLAGRPPLPDFLPVPLPDFFFAMARSRCLPCGAHFHINHAIYSSPITLADFARIVVSARGEKCSPTSTVSSATVPSLAV